MWPTADGYPVKPPVVNTMFGRPKKVRRRDPFEKDPKRPDMLRKQCIMTCQMCKQEGHNSRTCKNAPTECIPKPQVKRGRPRKVQHTEASTYHSGVTRLRGQRLNNQKRRKPSAPTQESAA